jgi:hypothetical protein
MQSSGLMLPTAASVAMVVMDARYSSRFSDRCPRHSVGISNRQARPDVSENPPIPCWQASARRRMVGTRSVSRFRLIPWLAVRKKVSHCRNSSFCNSDNGILFLLTLARRSARRRWHRKARAVGITYEAWFSRPIVVANTSQSTVGNCSMRSISAFQDVSLSWGRRSRRVRVFTSHPKIILDSSGEPSAVIFSNASRSSRCRGSESVIGLPNRCSISSVIREPFHIAVGLSKKHVNRSSR